jgi:hypothetical protein
LTEKGILKKIPEKPEPFRPTGARLVQEGEMKRILDRVEELWCMSVHSQTMWPYKGRYQCGVCLREYPVPFEQPFVAKPRCETRFVAGGVAVRRA